MEIKKILYGNSINRKDLIKCYQKDEDIKKKHNRKMIKKRKEFVKNLWYNVKLNSTKGKYSYSEILSIDYFYSLISIESREDGEEWFYELQKEMKKLGYSLSKEKIQWGTYYDMRIEVLWDKDYSEED